MENQVNMPKLRFPEFSDRWEKKKLGDVTTYVDYRGRAPIKTDSGIFLVTAKNIKKGYIDYESSQEFVADDNYLNVMSKGLPEIGDILFTTEAPMGNVAQVDNKKIALAQRVIKFRGNEKILNLYLLHYMLSDIFQNKLFEKAIGTTVQGISGKELHKIKVDFPSLPEQQKIASFLTAVDEKLQSLKKKKKLLDQYKKGVMQKIFSQELRFRADDGNEFPEWEENKLGDLVKIFSGYSPSMYELNENDDYPFIKVEELNNSDKYQFHSRNYTNSTKGLIKVNSIIFAKRGAAILINKIRINKVPLIMDSNLMALECSSKMYFEFLYYFIDYEKLYKIADTSSIPQINNKHIEPYFINLPDLYEQTKIANFLSSIDEKINLVNGQIEKMEMWKKGLLQKMFV